MKYFYVYMMANHRPTMYVGITNDLKRRVFEHKHNFNPKSFTAKYGLKKLVHFEQLYDSYNAIIREKQIKNMSRLEKIKMVEGCNKDWKDLYPGLFESGKNDAWITDNFDFGPPEAGKPDDKACQVSRADSRRGGNDSQAELPGKTERMTGDL